MNRYTINDAKGRAHTLATGEDFTSLIQRVDNIQESEAADWAPLGSFIANPVAHRYAELDGYDDVLLARWGITRTVIPDPVVPTVPQEVSAARLQLVLLTEGKLDAVEAYMDEPTTPREHKILWTRQDLIGREGELAAVVSGVLNLTPAKVDDLFRAADILTL